MLYVASNAKNSNAFVASSGRPIGFIRFSSIACLYFAAVPSAWSARECHADWPGVDRVKDGQKNVAFHGPYHSR